MNKVNGKVWIPEKRMHKLKKLTEGESVWMKVSEVLAFSSDLALAKGY